MMKKLNKGPGVLITSAFIGPGTVTICLLAGVHTGLRLLWAVVFSTIATIVIQDMCIRLGYFSKKGLEESAFSKMKQPLTKKVISLFIFLAIIVGNTAYQSGNVAGTGLGVEMMDFGLDRSIVLIGVFIFCMFFILKGSYELIKQVLSILVFFMSVTFLLVAVLQFPNWVDLLEGCLVPKFEKKELLLIAGLIGTTIVPYNLFMHTTLVAEQKEMGINALRKDSFFAIALGGLISMAIVIIGNKAKGMGLSNASEMASLLGNTAGVFSKYLLGLGLCCAGLSSALTAPLAAGLVAAGLFGWDKDFRSYKLKSVLIFVLTIGFIVAYTQMKTLYVIKIAQVLNGILLPFFAIYLLWILNDRDLMKVHKNTTPQNILGALVVLVTLILCVRSILVFV
jgi:manganese transport protein